MYESIKRGVDPYADADAVRSILQKLNKNRHTAAIVAGSTNFISPVDGYITRLIATAIATVTAGGAITVEVNDVAVAGLTVVPANGAAAGTKYDGAPTPGTPTAKVSVGDKIEIIGAGGFTANSVIAVLEITIAE